MTSTAEPVGTSTGVDPPRVAASWYHSWGRPDPGGGTMRRSQSVNDCTLVNVNYPSGPLTVDAVPAQGEPAQ